MKRIINTIFVCCLLAAGSNLLSSCEDMENEPLELQSDIYVWDESDYTGEFARQWLNHIYSYVPSGYERFDGMVQEVLTDDAIPTNTTNRNWSVINSGYSITNMFALSTRRDKDEYGESWAMLYGAIRKCNIFLANYQKVPWADLKEAGYYGNEARALRAYFYWLLIRAYGGVPLIGDKVFAVDSPELRQLTRSTFAECVAYIRSEFAAVKDNLRPYADLGSRKCPNTGKNSEAQGTDLNFYTVRKYGVLGIEARMLLFAASPLINGTGNSAEPWLGYPENDPMRYKEAADICREIITSGMFDLEPNRSQLSRTEINGENLWFRRGQYGNGMYNNSWGYRNSPMGSADPNNIGRQCDGQTSPTQELVDAFPMKDGRTIEEAEDYDPQNPYANRDPRLSQTIFLHESRWLRRTLDMSEGGADNNPDAGPDNINKRTLTGYYAKRHLAEDEEETTFHKTNYHGTLVGGWMVLRYADILLMYAEAQTEYLNKALGQATIAEEEIYTAIERVRQRAGLIPFAIARNQSYDALIKLIRTERRCEFAFEESRFWDIRRWKIAEDVYSKPLHGVRITRNGDDTFTYDYNMVVTTPYWDDRMYRLPIDNNEILFNPNIKQNPGYY